MAGSENFLTSEFIVAKVEVKGPVRVDLLGGTLDLVPINLILPNVVTLNMATSLNATVKVWSDSQREKDITIVSRDYQSEEQFNWNDVKNNQSSLNFLLQIVTFFKDIIAEQRIVIETSSDAPAGSGLGGSSAMGVTLFKALCQYFNLDFDRKRAIEIVHSIEGKILNKGPAGYQDYYPALFGGILALWPHFSDIRVEQFYSREIQEELEKRLTLVSSGISRHSGINNWEVYKAFFDNQKDVREGLAKIADLAHQGHQALIKKDIDLLVEIIGQEGQTREQLFSGIVVEEVKELFKQASENFSGIGMKVCGAGGGGCFIITHSADQKEQIREFVSSHNMDVLDFNIVGTIH